jgi:FkbM family methyltransferase
MTLIDTLLDHYREDVATSLRSFLKERGDHSLVLFGAGYQGGLTLLELHAMGLSRYVRCFIDNQSEKWGTEIHQTKVFSPSILKDLPLDTPILITVGHYAPIMAQLKEEGFTANVHVIDASALLNGLYDREKLVHAKKRIDELCDSFDDDRSRDVLEQVLTHRLTGDSAYLETICENLQYFPEDIVKLKGNEIFVDGGAYDGDTIQAFLRVSRNCFEGIHAFEPDRRNFEKLTESVAGHPLRNRIYLYNQALFSHRTELNFDEGPSMSSRIDAQGKTMIQAISVDEALNGERASFIKFDLEGAEKEALPGAEQTIRTWRPKLAISIYHLADDLWNLPEIIRTMTPGYRYYLRHYSFLTTETVLYAIPEID